MGKPRPSEMIAEMLGHGWNLEFVAGEFRSVSELRVSADDDRSFGDEVHVYRFKRGSAEALAAAVARAWAGEPPDRRD